MTPAELQEAVRLGMERARRASSTLAEQGWSLPMLLSPAGTYRVLKAGSPAEIDAQFVRLYDADEGWLFDRLADDLLNRDGLSSWRILLEQTISAYRRREFAITVPALLTICEGVLMRSEGNSTGLRAVVRERAKAEQHRFPESVHAILWHNVHGFVDELFKRSDFSGPRPSRLNRHSILHGRDVPTWTQADCLRLFQAVHTLSSLNVE